MKVLIVIKIKLTEVSLDLKFADQAKFDLAPEHLTRI